jgi:type IV pilus assembly protein PilY1
MIDYCGSGNNVSIPPYLSAGASPLVMFVIGRDQKLYFEAYNDASDIDGDGAVDVGYKHQINYYGYFDSNKCYVYNTTSGRFNPNKTTADKYCGGSDEWSGNFLNWLSMSRIDSIRKVLYGGYRSTDATNETVLAGTFIPRDAHAWGKEYAGNDTRLLTPFEKPSNLLCEFKSSNYNLTSNNPVLITYYVDNGDTGVGCGTGDLTASFKPSNYYTHHRDNSMTEVDYLSSFYGNMMMVTYFTPNTTGEHGFSVDGSQNSVLQVFGPTGDLLLTVSDTAYCDTFDLLVSRIGTINLTRNTEYKIIIRVRRNTNSLLMPIGAYAYIGRPTIPLPLLPAVWTWQNLDEYNTYGTLRGYDIGNSASDACGLKTASFIETGVPRTGAGGLEASSDLGRRHLFCVASEFTSSPNNAQHPQRIRVLRNRDERAWNWASVSNREGVGAPRNNCGNYIDTNNDGEAETDVGTQIKDYFVRVKVCDPAVGEEANCYNYGSGSKKPIGILQKYGTGSQNTICSKTNEANTSCATGSGFPVKESPMYFGLITGSYQKNLSGGVVRKNITSISDEIEADGRFKTTVSAGFGGIIQTLNNFRTIDFNDGFYYANCRTTTTGPMSIDGECRNWGNPIGEMYWEALRYLAGFKIPTSAFTYAESQDGGLNIPKPTEWRDPYADFPACSEPNIVLISDIYPNYDNSVPTSGSGFNDYNLSSLFSSISADEGINGQNFFIGTNSVTNDSMCSPKRVSSLGNAQGLCPEEPTKGGTYNTSALAHYASTKFEKNTHAVAGKLQNITTHAIALSSNVPEINIKVNNRNIKIVPLGKSIRTSTETCGSGSNYYISNCYIDSRNIDPLYGLVPPANSYCPSNPIVDFYAEYITATEGRFRINFEDVEQGSDNDMDAVARYDYRVNANGTVTISLKSEFSMGCIQQAMGFIITGTTQDGVYLPLSDIHDSYKDSSSIEYLPIQWSKTYTPSTTGGSNTSLLKDPLWYAAKYGGGGVNSRGEPENYHLITNPTLLEEKMSKVFSSILKRASVGTAPSFESGKNRSSTITTSMFYPEKEYPVAGGQPKKITWAGELFSYWFFRGAETQSIYEDTNTNKKLDLCDNSVAGGDKIVEFAYDATGSLRIDRYNTNCQGSKTTLEASNLKIGDIKSLWEGGEKLASTPASQRTIYTNVNGVLTPFTTANAPQFISSLGTLTGTCLGNANNLINYIRGTDISGCRSRTMPNGNVYKLGDILNSTPVMVDYPNVTGRPGYTMSYIGANDGMLHAFRAGRASSSNLSPFQTMRVSNDFSDQGLDKLGREEWAFIPRHALPYLRYLADPNYCHIYYNDLEPFIIEEDTNNDGYVDKRILIGGMRLGGACGATQAGVKPPTDTCADTSNANCVGLSSYYALDITNQNSPVLLWEFSDKDLGFSFSGPAYIKKNNSRHVMFVSGPTDYAGTAGQRLSVFVLTLDSNYKQAAVRKYTGETRTGFTRVPALASYTNSFGGKLVTKGVDYGNDGNTDAVFFGVNQNVSNLWTGNVVGVNINVTGGENPDNWIFNNLFTSAYTAGKPITQKIVHSKCFGMNYLYFGTGRWFFKIDDAGASGDTNYLYGVRIDGCPDGNCNLSSANILANSNAVCTELAKSTNKFAWRKTLDQRTTGFLKERLLSDPEPLDYANAIFFGTTEPGADICSYGGRSRLWGLNCALGSAFGGQCTGGSYKVEEEKVPGVWTPRTPGTILQEKPVGAAEATAWQEGAILSAIQTSPAPAGGFERSGKLLFWIEK